MTYESEDSLINALLNKQEAAFRQVIKTHQSSMKHLAISLTGNSIADEVVQEAWVSAMRGLPKFERRSSLKTWLLRIVANEAKTRLRKENRMVSLDAMTAEDSDMSDRFNNTGHWEKTPNQWDTDSPEGILATAELQACINELIENLPDMQSATLSLRENQGHSLAEICNILDVSESNVRVLLHRARNRLFCCIEHFQETGECCTT